jgi:hypothetical protein
MQQDVLTAGANSLEIVRKGALCIEVRAASPSTLRAISANLAAVEDGKFASTIGDGILTVHGNPGAACEITRTTAGRWYPAIKMTGF